ncbi:MAG: hypothetical protein JWO90_1375 [Solirubrobacterales bacterium]|jgi:hypothetical protein|nr:hypothetical protein [Solirubrobacterales bacterium]
MGARKKKARDRGASGPDGERIAVAVPPAKRRERHVRSPEPQPRLARRFDERDGVRRPEPLWGARVPATEIGLFLGLLLFVSGFVAPVDQRPTLIGGGALLATGFVYELCLREHRSGFKSHTMLLAFVPIVVLHTLVFFLVTERWAGPIPLFLELAVFGVLAAVLHGRFRTAQVRAQAQR